MLFTGDGYANPSLFAYTLHCLLVIDMFYEKLISILIRIAWIGPLANTSQPYVHNINLNS